MSALEGVRVLELGHGVAGPFAARLLADLGADVVKVEQPGVGDFARRLEPGTLFEYLNWNKRSVALDLHHEADREHVRRLVAGVDIVVESFRPGRLEAWGLGPGALRAANPGLVVTSVSSFGQTGPYAGWLGSDLVFQAMSGVMQISGTADREPLKRGLRQSLYEAGLTAAYASIAAYYGGAGAHVDVSIHECVASELVLNQSWYTSMGAVQGRRPLRRDPLGGPLGGGDPIPCADGYVSLQISGVVSVEELAEFLGEPRLAEAEFATTEARLENVEELNSLLARRLAGERGRDFFLRASEAGYLVGVVQGARELLACPQLDARGVWRELDGVRYPSALVTPVEIQRRAPKLGEHTHEVLAEPPRHRARGSEPRTRTGPPLAGVRVLDLSYVFATPYLGGLLADFGAEVIKIEAPHRLDQTRTTFSPFFENDPGDEFWDRAGVFHVVNRGKRSLALDLGREEGREALRRLATEADVLLENYTPRVMRKWGLTYDDLAELNPGLIMLSNTGYGSTGPWAGFRAQGTTLEATMGVAHYAGYPGCEPSKVGQSYPDFLACWTGMLAILAALVHRRRTGEGQWIDLGMYQLGAAVLADGLLHYQATGEDVPRRGSEDLGAGFSGVFRAAGDDRWLAVSAESEEQVRAAVGATAEWIRERDPHEAAALLQAAGIAAGPVYDQRDLLTDPHLRARGFYEHVECGGRLRPLIGRPYRWTSDAPAPAVRGPGPRFAEANPEILGSAAAPVDPRPVQPLDLEVMLRSGALARVDPDYLELADPRVPALAGGTP